MLVTGVSIGDVGRRPCGPKVPSELSRPLSPTGAEEVQAGGSLGVVSKDTSSALIDSWANPFLNPTR
jgi:hypothetical protein